MPDKQHRRRSVSYKVMARVREESRWKQKSDREEMCRLELMVVRCRADGMEIRRGGEVEDDS